MRFIYIIFIIILACNHKLDENLASQIVSLEFDSRKSEKLDLSSIASEDFSIIPLETNDSCLIGKIDKIEWKNDLIFIMDQLSKTIYIFNESGKFKNKIHKVGGGPGEYLDITSMTVTDDRIIIADRLSQKQLEYDYSCNFINESRIFSMIWFMDMFYFDNKVYYHNNYSNSSFGKFRLFSKPVNLSDKYATFLPFSVDPIALSLQGSVYASCDNNASVIYTGCDTIFNIEQGGTIAPKYVVEYQDKKASYTSGDVAKVFQENTNNEVLGISSIDESHKYLLIAINTVGQNDYLLVYDKENNKIIISDIFLTNKFYTGNFEIKRIIDNKIINWTSPHTFNLMFQHINMEDYFISSEYKDRLLPILSNSNEFDNPILFVHFTK